MRWLIIVLLVSVGALLIASGGMAYHIWRSRKKRTLKSSGSTESLSGKTEETDVETEEAP